MASDTFVRIFIRSVILVLVMTAFLKLWAGASEDPALGRLDEVIWFLSKRQLVTATAFLELCVAFLLFRYNRNHESLRLVLWLGMVFLLYRALRWLMAATGFCSCMGSRMGSLGDSVSKWLLVWMLAGSLLLILFRKLDTLTKSTRPSSAEENSE